MDQVQLSSSWVQSQGDLSSSLNIVDLVEQFSVDNVNIESCVELTPSSDGQRCELCLTSTSVSTTGLVLVSSSPRWEIVGDLQYLLSLQGSLLEDCSTDEIKVYVAQLKLKSGYSRLSLRLPPSHVTPCWVFSLQLVISPTSPADDRNFNISKVNSLLEGGGNLSDKSSKFKDLFEQFQSGQNKSTMIAPKISDLMSNPMLMSSMLGGPKNVTGNGEDKAEFGLNDQSFVLMKSYIDSKFETLEQNLVSLMENKEKQQSEKLDKILKLLESKD